MASMHLPAGTYYERYAQDQAWWPTRFVRLRMAGLALLLLLLPRLINPAYLSVANLVGYTILGALGVQLLIGYTGQVTLGHAAFIAVGAYTAAFGIVNFHLPYPVTVVLAALAAGLWSVVFGLPSARVKGYYLIMTSMAAQFITVDFLIAQYIAPRAGRNMAIALPPGTIRIGPWAIDSDLRAYYLMLALAALCTVAMGNLLRTRVGRAWIAIRDNDIAAEVMGVNVFKYKLLAYFVAGALAGIAGAYWITTIFAVSTEHFPWDWSLWLVGVILIGGVGSLYGVFFGSIFITVLVELLRNLAIVLQPTFPELIERFAYVRQAAFGLAIILFLLKEPKGLAYRWWQIKNYIHLWPFSD